MHQIPRRQLDRVLKRLADRPAAEVLARRRARTDASVPDPDLYREAADLLEQALWQEGAPADLISLHQGLFQEMESHWVAMGRDPRHDFVVVIPVADRPRQLRQCLTSLLTLCRIYRYGEVHQGRFAKVSVLIADDSRQPQNVRSHRLLAQEMGRDGLLTHHLAPADQRRLWEGLDCGLRRRLATIVADAGDETFAHKGASITRNLAYLWLARHQDRYRSPLFWFVDSDQEFQVLVKGPGGDRELYALNYFHQLDRVFRETGVQVLTGKVVGAPPVSPAVMAGNLLEDLGTLLGEMADRDPEAPCVFHPRLAPPGGDAAYHDMADLFGFRPHTAPRRFACPLAVPHSHKQSLEDLVGRLDAFFDGDHPTRRMYFEYREPLASLQPARTVYTGNYLLRPEALDWFIPFAPLKLRMAGPTLGRLVRAGLSHRFVACNLPLLHKRTLVEKGRAEYRSGIRRGARGVDLSGELKRQYLGDLVLFSMERLVQRGYPSRYLEQEEILRVLKEIDQDLNARYRHLHGEVGARLDALEPLVRAPAHWWNRPPLENTTVALNLFLNNLRANFGSGSPGYAWVVSEAQRIGQLKGIATAIVHYRDDREAWTEALHQCARDAMNFGPDLPQ